MMPATSAIETAAVPATIKSAMRRAARVATTVMRMARAVVMAVMRRIILAGVGTARIAKSKPARAVIATTAQRTPARCEHHADESGGHNSANNDERKSIHRFCAV
jgi:hypothetical protein